VNILLDTSVLIWARSDVKRLRLRARQAIQRADRVVVSVVSGWELAMKESLGRFALKADLEAGLAESEFDQLDLSWEHLSTFRRLPRLHADPFDRMLIAQAHCESLTIVTSDRAFEEYQVPVIWT